MRVSSHRATLAIAGVASLLVALALPPDRASGAVVNVTGGRTSVALDNEVLGGTGLSIGTASPEVQTPGDIPDSIAFPINANDAADRPSTFTYDPADFVNTFGGTIEHSGTVGFNTAAVQDALQVGNFSLGFDAARQGTLNGLASGFFVQSNTAASNAVLFDVGNPAPTATDTALTIDGDLLVSPEFAALLQTLAPDITTDFSGVDIGNARVAATASGDQPPPPPPVIPLPPALVPGLIGLGAVGGFKWMKRK